MEDMCQLTERLTDDKYPGSFYLSPNNFVSVPSPDLESFKSYRQFFGVVCRLQFLFKKNPHKRSVLLN